MGVDRRYGPPRDEWWHSGFRLFRRVIHRLSTGADHSIPNDINANRESFPLRRRSIAYSATPLQIGTCEISFADPDARTRLRQWPRVRRRLPGELGPKTQRPPARRPGAPPCARWVMDRGSDPHRGYRQCCAERRTEGVARGGRGCRMSMTREANRRRPRPSRVPCCETEGMEGPCSMHRRDHARGVLRELGVTVVLGQT